MKHTPKKRHTEPTTPSGICSHSLSIPPLCL